ncbi:hypothetical protein D9M68_929460 [compost metagenome]
MVAAFGFYNLTGMWILVALDHALTALVHRRRTGSLDPLGVEDVDHGFQSETILLQKRTKFGFEFDFALQFSIVFQVVQGGQLLGNLSFEAFEFCKFAHVSPG